MSYNTENKIQYGELAPSLQQRLIDLTTLYNSSHTGQTLKVDTINKDLIADDNFFKCRVVNSLAELNQEKETTIMDLSSVFDTWSAYAHGNISALTLLDNSNNTLSAEGQNLAVAPYNTFTSGKAWSYNSSTGTISNVTTANVVSGFIAPANDYNNYTLNVKIDTGGSNDSVMIIVGFYTDANNVQHTLTVARSSKIWNGSTDNLFTWGLIYDMGNSTQQFLVNMTTSDTSTYDCNGNSHNYVYLTVTRLGATITAKTSDYSNTGTNTTVNDNLTFSYTMPTSKTTGMSDEMFTNLGNMLNYPSSVGFGARDVACTFTILSQSGIWDNGYIYSLYDNQVYSYNTFSTAWESIGTLDEHLSSRILLYNSTFNTLYFYYYKNIYQKITVLPSSINANTLGGYLAIGDNNGVARSWPYIPVINSNDGGMEIGRYIDFHYLSNDSSDFGSRISLESDGNMAFSDHSGSRSIDLDTIISKLGNLNAWTNGTAGIIIINDVKIQYGSVAVTWRDIKNGSNFYFQQSFANNGYVLLICDVNYIIASSYQMSAGFLAYNYTQTVYSIPSWTQYTDHIYVKNTLQATEGNNPTITLRYLAIGN